MNDIITVLAKLSKSLLLWNKNIIIDNSHQKENRLQISNLSSNLYNDQRVIILDVTHSGYEIRVQNNTQILHILRVEGEYEIAVLETDIKKHILGDYQHSFLPRFPL